MNELRGLAPCLIGRLGVESAASGLALRGVYGYGKFTQRDCVGISGSWLLHLWQAAGADTGFLLWAIALCASLSHRLAVAALVGLYSLVVIALVYSGLNGAREVVRLVLYVD